MRPPAPSASPSRRRNAARYDGIVGLLANVDAAKAVAAYRRIYPQLQKAYEDLGYPGRYFNDRVVRSH